jgi:hypothetical protein
MLYIDCRVIEVREGLELLFAAHVCCQLAVYWNGI